MDAPHPPTRRRSDAEVGFEASLDALDNIEPGLGQFARNEGWACSALQRYGTLSEGKLERLRLRFHAAMARKHAPPWTSGQQEITGVVRSFSPGLNGPRMVLACPDGRRCFGPVPRQTKLREGMTVKITTVLVDSAADDPTYGFFRYPSACEVVVE